jgi:hypothetical protein
VQISCTVSDSLEYGAHCRRIRALDGDCYNFVPLKRGLRSSTRADPLSRGFPATTTRGRRRSSEMLVGLCRICFRRSPAPEGRLKARVDQRMGVGVLICFARASCHRNSQCPLGVIKRILRAVGAVGMCSLEPWKVSAVPTEHEVDLGVINGYRSRLAFCSRTPLILANVRVRRLNGAGNRWLHREEDL